MGENTHLLIFGGPALSEERFMDWNFVSSSQERILQARQDWNNRLFPAVSGDSTYIPHPLDKHWSRCFDFYFYSGCYSSALPFKRSLLWLLQTKTPSRWATTITTNSCCCQPPIAVRSTSCPFLFCSRTPQSEQLGWIDWPSTTQVTDCIGKMANKFGCTNWKSPSHWENGDYFMSTRSLGEICSDSTCTPSNLSWLWW